MSQPSSPSLEYLDQFVFCGLCFKKMHLKGEAFSCPSHCFADLSARVLEELLWSEMGKILANPSFKKDIQDHLRGGYSSQQCKMISKDFKGFIEFLPVEEKIKFTTALVEKMDILSNESVKIHFRL